MKKNLKIAIIENLINLKYILAIIVIFILIITNFSTKNKPEVIQTKQLVSSEMSEKPETTSVNIVHIKGAVNKPGVYQIEEDARMGTLITMAGGYNQANQQCINEAQKIVDEMEIIIPSIAEECDVASTVQSNNNNNDNSSAKVNINTATSEQLQTLPGIGQTRADAIIEYRTQYGKFKTIEELQNVSGIGPASLAKMQTAISI